MPLIKGTETMNLFSKLHSSSTRICSKFLNFKKDSKGVAAVEFALIAPILLLLFVGTIEVSLMIAVDRKISRTSSAIADLIAQGGFSSNNSEAEMRAIFGMTDRIMYPYSTRIPCVVISQVEAKAEDTNGDGTIDDDDEVIARVIGSIDNNVPNSNYTSPAAGQCSKSSAGLAADENARQKRIINSIFVLPDAINTDNTKLIVAEVEYDHKPVVGLISSSGTGKISIDDSLFTLGDRIFLRPRVRVDLPTN